MSTLYYEGKRTPDGAIVLFDGQSLPMPDIAREISPTGFEWGYGGSGPNALAVAMLDHVLQRLGLPAARSIVVAAACAQEFKGRIVARLNREWRIEEITLKADVLHRYGPAIDALAMYEAGDMGDLLDDNVADQ